MKFRILSFAVLVSLMSHAALAAPRTVTLDIPNMTCPVCPITVMKSLDGLAGVKKVSVDFPNRTATVDFDDSQTSDDKLTEATKAAGYPSTVRQGS